METSDTNFNLGTRALQSNPNKEAYNNVPVAYCKHCLSLKVRGLDGMSYCDDCGSTDIDECHISEWEKMYEQKHGKSFLNN